MAINSSLKQDLSFDNKHIKINLIDGVTSYHTINQIIYRKTKILIFKKANSRANASIKLNTSFKFVTVDVISTNIPF